MTQTEQRKLSSPETKVSSYLFYFLFLVIFSGLTLQADPNHQHDHNNHNSYYDSGAETQSPSVVYHPNDPQNNYPSYPSHPQVSLPSHPTQGPHTGISGGNQHGNANTGGVQVQNVTVEASPVVNQDSDNAATSSSSSTSSAAVDSAIKLRQDTENAHNALLLQKIESDRLKDEWKRRGAINSFSSANDCAPSGCVDVDPCHGSHCGGTVVVDPVVVDHHVVTPSPVVTSHYTPRSASRFKLSPFVGYKFIEDESCGDLENQYMMGFTFEGALNRYFSLEGVFTYSKDKLGYTQNHFNNYGYNNYDPYNQGYQGSSSRSSYEFGVNAKLGPNLGVFRPYGIAGVGYIYQDYDISDMEDYAQLQGWNQMTNYVYSELGAGLDIGLGNNFSIGARASYQYLFDSDNKFGDMNNWWADNSNRYKLSINAALNF